jgi:serine/threonine-protein phosphatase 4 regulatory subunit 4
MKTEEELKKLSTDENLSELDKGIHLLWKGYEIQKKSIIQHLDRYMQEPDSNAKLVPII